MSRITTLFREIRWRLAVLLITGKPGFTRDDLVNTLTISSPSPLVLFDAMKTVQGAGFKVQRVWYVPGPPLMFFAEFDTGEDKAKLAELAMQLNAAAAEMGVAVTEASKV